MRSCLLALVLVSAVLPARAEPVVAVVKSASLAPYDEALLAFSLEVRAELVEYDLRGDEERAAKAFAHLRANRPALVWALGAYAATMARRELPDVPLVFALVPTYERYDLSGPQVTGIALTRPPRAELETLRAFSPAARRIGVVHDPRSSAAVVEEARRAGIELGLELVTLPVRDATQIPSRLASVEPPLDALWMVADRTVSSTDAFHHLLAWARARRLPLFALSEDQVRAGALVSLSPDVSAIGRQAARIVNRVLHDRVSPRALPVVDPDGLALSVNVTTARALAEGGALALEIFSFAAKRQYPIRAFE